MIDRRKLLGAATLGAAGLAATACSQSTETADGVASPAIRRKKTRLTMTTTWPKDLPGLGAAANRVAERVAELSDGQIEIQVYAAGELVPAFEAFDAVASGNADMYHGADYYWQSKSKAYNFFTAVPMGMTAAEAMGWIDFGGGQALWEELSGQYGIIAFQGANTGHQMGGWFRKEINSLDDFRGLKMRIPGLGGDVIRELGGAAEALPGNEIYQALQTGRIDATEWVNPYNDLAFGLHKAAKYYYYPGWHEPGTTLECFLNKEIFDSLPEDLQNIITGAAKIANLDMLSEYIARNNEALKILKDKHKVNIMPLPDEVLEMLHNISNEVISEIAKKDKFSMQVYDSYKNFQKKTSEWSKISIKSYLNI